MRHKTYAHGAVSPSLHTLSQHDGDASGRNVTDRQSDELAASISFHLAQSEINGEGMDRLNRVVQIEETALKVQVCVHSFDLQTDLVVKSQNLNLCFKVMTPLAISLSAPLFMLQCSVPPWSLPKSCR